MIIFLSLFTMLCFPSASLNDHSHQIPVQFLRRHLLEQRLETTFEEDLEAKVVLDDQRGLQSAVCYLNTHMDMLSIAQCVKKYLMSAKFSAGVINILDPF